MKITCTESKIGMLWLFSSMIVIGLFLLTAKPALAVVGNVSLVSGGEPVAQATISFQTADGQVVAEGETDDDGKAAIVIPDSYKGQSLTVVAEKGDQTTRQSVDVDRDDLKIAMLFPAAVGVRDGYDLSLGVSTLYKWSDFDGDHDYLSGGQSESGSLDSSAFGFGVDLQLRPPSRFLGGLPFFFALGFGLPIDLDDDGVKSDYHPGGGLESYLSVDENWYLRVMLGYELMALQQLQLYLLGGVQFTDVDAEFTTDESGGGGVVNRFSDSETMTSPVLGIGFSHPVFSNIKKAYLYGSLYLAWMDDISGGGTSTLGMQYQYSVDGGVQPEIQLGVRIHF